MAEMSAAAERRAAERREVKPFAKDTDDPHLLSPLAPFAGEKPAAPAWFRAAIDAPHERHKVQVEGADVEWLGWGERGKPGLLLLHGNGANADWWRFVAPFLADTHRVAALSWSGMGGSDHRPAYTGDQFVREALAVAEAAGLGERFAVAGHSFGGMPTVLLAAGHPDRVAQAIIIDTPLGDNRRPPHADDPKPHRIYPTLAEALARFRWSPMQPSPNPWITDFIARSSLRQAEGGWTWKFDPMLWKNFSVGDVDGVAGRISVPVAYLWGEQSVLAEHGVVRLIRTLLPAGTRFVGLPDAHHHVMADQPLALVSALRALLA
ncbi:alpha/beta fold hydrolase [Sandaracinobacteroides hominis]|uniref:alpha/beta fold hydrolase n=1 Tax=Sandaracinobacteroides hominis TaxID=2780086 RepID=UPI0018F2850D|nr:alpha/beta hydrolase [Sandaracinobacteroides hominis]